MTIYLARAPGRRWEPLALVDAAALTVAMDRRRERVEGLSLLALEFASVHDVWRFCEGMGIPEIEIEGLTDERAPTAESH